MKFVKEQLKTQCIKEQLCSPQQNNTPGTKECTRGQRVKLPNGNDNVGTMKRERANTNNIRLQYNGAHRLLHNKIDIYEKHTP